MADTRVTTTGDRRVTTTGDVRVTEEGLETLIVFEQSVRRYGDAETLVTFEQRVGVFGGPDTLVTFAQAVRNDPVLGAAETLVTHDQTVYFQRESAAQTLITFDQRVERESAAETLITFRQTVLSAAQAAAQPMRIYLDGSDITERCSRAVSVVASEGDNRTAQVIYRPPSGAINVPSFRGKPLEIQRIIDGSLTPLFHGQVDVPVYDPEARTLSLRGSDFRNERVGREDHDHLKQLTGGLYTDITQRPDASGEQWVRELMKTVPGTLDYTSGGALRYSPWAVGTPRYNLTASDIHHREVRLDTTRSETINRVPATLEYRYFKRNTFTETLSLEMRRADQGVGGSTGQLHKPGDTIPTKEALYDALTSVPGWHLLEYHYHRVPDDGWYKFNASDTNPTGFAASDTFRQLRAMGVDATLERYISQPKRERYQLTIEAPQSIEQFGEVDGESLRFSAVTRVDPSVYEERGCTVVLDPDDRRADVEAALQAMQRMGERTILEAHRKNTASVRYKPSGGGLLPVEIGDPISVDVGEIAATGVVAGFSHQTTRSDDHWTDITLAVSSVDSELSVTEDWSLPAAPTKYVLNADSAAISDEPACPEITPDEDDPQRVTGGTRIDTETGEVIPPSHITPRGDVVVVMPEISRSNVDEIIGTRTKAYPVDIPKNQFDVEVP